MNNRSCRVDDIANTARTRFFSLDQANQALVLVRRIVADIVGGYAQLMDLQETLEAIQGRQPRPRCEELRQELIRMVERLQLCLGELEEVGVELKDWATGMVDFACIWHGRQVMLSWQHGEPAISHWHQVDESFATRHPLSHLLMEQMALSAQK